MKTDDYLEKQHAVYTQEVAALQALQRGVGRTILGKEAVVEKLLCGALAGGHILMEDFPGLGKTLLVKTFSRCVSAEFKRVQFTPDILPTDIIGTRIWNNEKRVFELQRGPVFTNILLADEINRAPPKTQSALLEAMEERQVTIDGETHKLPRPFFVLATQNPVEQEGTYPLPEAQMDRFLLRLSMGYPQTDEEEAAILQRRSAWAKDDPTSDLKPVMDLPTFQTLIDRVEGGVHTSADVMLYIGRVVRAVRAHPQVRVGPSPRGSLALYKLSKAMALMRGRDFVVPDDVKVFAVDALAHRTLLKIEDMLAGAVAEKVVRESVAGVPLPQTRAQRKQA
ncbi:MAG TPA: MoxR family ATPase [Candidatus Thermoplasmatota archaeon]|nr:MoxR family ATPase [Candidatus Thermoplasmatota archaeon]